MTDDKPHAKGPIELVVETLPPGHDRADTGNYVANEFRDGYLVTPVVATRGGRLYLVLHGRVFPFQLAHTTVEDVYEGALNCPAL